MGFDNIESPEHYISGRKIEPIEVIEDWDLSPHLANVIKYISRIGRKEDTRSDYKKAIWYLERSLKLYLNRNSFLDEECSKSQCKG